MNRFINHVIVPEARKVGLDCFEGIGEFRSGIKQSKEIFQHRKLKSWNQRVYMLGKEDYENHHEPKFEQRYTVLKMSKALYENNNNTFKNIDFYNQKFFTGFFFQ